MKLRWVHVQVAAAFAAFAAFADSVPSISDGEMTYLQFGVSGAADCTGDIVVGPQQVQGKYSCQGVTSYDPGTGQMGKVDIEIRFVALS